MFVWWCACKIDKKIRVKISVIIATYNSEGTIRNCLASLAGQSTNKFEVIIIDGCSSDGTVEIIKQSHIVSYFISEKDDGIYDAWNKGLNFVSGKWVMFLGSDDTLDKFAIENYIDFLDTNKGFDFVSARANFVDENNRILEVIGEKWEYRKMRRFMNVCHTSSLTNINLFDKYGIFNKSYKIAGDYEFLLRVGKELKAGYIDKIQCNMRQGGLSTKLISKVLRESYIAKRSSGNVSIILCLFDYCYAFIVNKIIK